MKIKNNYCPIKGFAWKAGCVLGVAAVLAGAFGVGKKMYDELLMKEMDMEFIHP